MLKLLVAEDEWLILSLIADALAGSRFEIAERTASVADSLRLIDGHHFDAAVLDANLGGESSQPVAARLQATGVPFLLLTAYASDRLGRSFGVAPRLIKPFTQERLRAALAALAGIGAAG
ncbi:MAG: response regulator [Hyphomicrobiaceae bacterium]|nr:response regulator [Hyphomicrobiaceae bacterium]